ncbi:MAG TPA: ferritin-like domain-containing protein [Candidatus Sulfopaludibacter sp.]|jgi:hypothetical protein|nr:ferritin-like domain-containing protein [Candidatus Sulfopaludibacter sp.]
MNEKSNVLERAAAEPLRRRSFFTAIGKLGLGAAAMGAVGGVSRAASHDFDNTSGDTAQQIFTAALIAEDLATVFYYNALTGPVIMDPNLAGTGGTATMTAANGNDGNVQYLRAALSEEIVHANLLRSLTGGSSPASDPVQTFYLPAGAFSNLATFLTILNALEDAFIGAYLNATLEFAQMAADSVNPPTRAQRDAAGEAYTPEQLEYFAEVAASIMGVESEHRVLGRVIGNMNPANNLNFEQTDGLTSVYNGSMSAVAALTPFLAPGSGLSAYSLSVALAGAPAIVVPAIGGLPPGPAMSSGKGR